MDGVITYTGNNRIHILIPSKRVSRDLLILGSFFFLFFVLVEMILLQNLMLNKIPWQVLLIPFPLPFISFILFGKWLKWQKTGQVVEIDEQRKRLVIREKKANILPSCREIPFDRIKGFSAVPFVVYTSGRYSSGGVTKGFCVSVIFHPQKLFWFIQKDTPGVSIGGYLTRDEVVELRRWLEDHIKKQRG